MTYQAIQTTLDDAVAAIENLPTFNRENTITKPVAGTPFVRSTFLPARPNQLTVGAFGRDQLIGLHQVDIYYPIGSGATAAKSKADLVVAAFPRTWMTEVEGNQLRVTQSWVEAGREVNNWYVCSAVLSWSLIR